MFFIFTEAYSEPSQTSKVCCLTGFWIRLCQLSRKWISHLKLQSKSNVFEIHVKYWKKSFEGKVWTCFLLVMIMCIWVIENQARIILNLITHFLTEHVKNILLSPLFHKRQIDFVHNFYWKVKEKMSHVVKCTLS